MDAIVKGTTAGLELLLNIIAMLIVLVALVYLANAILGYCPTSAAPESRCSGCSATPWRRCAG
jgi:nucleoside permease NupC